MRHPNSERFHSLLRLAGNTHDAKQKDYGSSSDPFANVRDSESLGIPPWIGAALRMNDKQVRLQKACRDTLKTGTPNLQNEGVLDTFLDMLVYSGIGYVLFEDWQSETNKYGSKELPGAENLELVGVISTMLDTTYPS